MTVRMSFNGFLIFATDGTIAQSAGCPTAKIITGLFDADRPHMSLKKVIGFGGSAGGLLMGAAVNQKPELFLAMILAVPFVDSLTTNLDHSLPLTVGEFDEFGNAKDNKEHF